MDGTPDRPASGRRRGRIRRPRPRRPSTYAIGEAATHTTRGPGRSAWGSLDVLCLTAMHRNPSRRYRLVDALVPDRAEAQTAGVQRIRRFMTQLFQGGDPEAGPSDTMRVITLLDRGVRQARSLAAEPAVLAELERTLAGIGQSLGRPERADSLLSDALDRTLKLPHPADADVARTPSLIPVRAAPAAASSASLPAASTGTCTPAPT